jgi:hypothetical protein
VLLQAAPLAPVLIKELKTAVDTKVTEIPMPSQAAQDGVVGSAL